ncbi:hypothetical protein [Rhizobium oryzicola]|uniref:Lipoprotein n=1 Tax=Rhizobium oryzicola TaxID=1232668 RepID=A0ABT8SVA3_9HYPH|nr:hypothetical protein [Rhizobium oryzicola]MDO1582370.1 hypothetical protein [Rhizobium oryzicola]
MKKIIALVLCGVAVSSCTATSRTNYDAGVTALAGSKSLRASAIEKCIIKARSADTAARHKVAVVMDVRDNQVDQLYCNRVINAAAAGRISYDEANNLHYGQITPNLIKIIQGR